MPAGRPSKFNDALAEKIYSLYKIGKTDVQVAKIIGVSEKTLNNWKGAHPEFLQSLNISKHLADDLVEASLFGRAVGYSHMEEKIFCYEGQIIRAKTRKQYPPDVAAGIFWLKNRQPERWRDTPILPPPEIQDVTPHKKSFADFCAAAKYPLPYPKQIEMINFGMNETDPRLLLGSRGYGKTDYVVILGVAYDIYLNPQTSTNLIITKSRERNSAMLGEIATACKANGMVFEIENSTTLRVNGLHGKDNSVSSVTIKTVSLRGRHPKRIIMDDPVTEDDTSDATRKKVEKVYNEVNKLAGNILIIGQPAHKFDLYAKLRTKIKCMEVPHGSIPELDHDLQAQRLAGVDEASIQASYFLKILSEGTTPFDNIKYVDKYPSNQNSVAWIDPSYEGGDYTALCIMTMIMGAVQVKGFCWKKAWNHCLNDMVPHLINNSVKKVAFETNNLGSQPVIMLGELLKQTGIGVVGRKSSLNKHGKIMSAGAYAHQIFLSEDSDKQFKDQVVQYEYDAKNDDAPDALASCLEWLGLIRGF